MDELFFRAILDIPKFYDKKNDVIVPAAFKDKNGFSVNIRAQRDICDCVTHLMSYLKGFPVCIKVTLCEEIGIHCVSAPSKTNQYHYCLSDDINSIGLTDVEKADFLSLNVKKLDPETRIKYYYEI